MERLRNISMDYFNVTNIDSIFVTVSLHSWVALVIALPVICLAIYGLFSLINKDHVTPVLVINLLISDVLQVCIKPVAFTLSWTGLAFDLAVFVYCLATLASVFFMVCIAGERYIMIAHPLWYRFHGTIRKTVVCSVIVWLTTLIALGCEFLMIEWGIFDLKKLTICGVIVYFLPYPFVLFFFIGTWKALSKSISLTGQEQRRIMGTLALVLFIYTVLFLPYIVSLLLILVDSRSVNDDTFQQFSMTSSFLLSLNPLTDPILYIIARKKSLFTRCFTARSSPPSSETGRFLAQRENPNTDMDIRLS